MTRHFASTCFGMKPVDIASDSQRGDRASTVCATPFEYDREARFGSLTTNGAVASVRPKSAVLPSSDREITASRFGRAGPMSDI
jgi:hypothetical protein